jgi:heat shock protein HtpX
MYDQIAANKQKTIGLMFGFFVLVGALALLLGRVYHNPSILLAIGVFSIAYSVWGYFGSSSLALSINGAQQIQQSNDPVLWRIIENLAITDGLPMPKVYIIDDPALNAFATGRDPQHASVAITTGLLQVLDKAELEGVMAHELGHIKNLDSRVSMIAFALVGVVSLVCDVFLRISFWGGGDDENNSGGGNILFFVSIVALILAPIVATLMQLAISRKREYLADATGALTTRYPEGLASALVKIRDYGSVLQKQNSSTAHFFIANPIKGGALSGLLSTHPPINDRIKILRHMVGVK